jgi:hemophore-related protein
LPANRESSQDLPADLIDGLPESAHFEGYLTPPTCNAGAGYSGRLQGEFARFSLRLPWISGRGNQRPNRKSKEEMLMKFTGITARRRIAGVASGCLLGGVAAATIAAPTAAAAPEVCTAGGVSNTVSTTLGSARAYLDTHPGANQAVAAASTQPRPQAADTLRGYFTANPHEYYDLRGILAPIGDTQRQCNVSVLPPDLASAFNEFMAG